MSRSGVIFTGPSLPPASIKKIPLGCDIFVFENFGSFVDQSSHQHGDEPCINILPPVSEGDIFKLTALEPRIIGIVDGYFENIPSVWHKEILYAMSKGIHVYGAASMGALRASELSTYGMTGTGPVFQAYRDGILEDDDEVTVVHGPRELGYPCLSEAMVNIRRTIDDAYNDRIIDARHRDLFIRALKNTFYKERSYSLLKNLDKADPEILDDFFQWLGVNRRDQKKEDATELLKKIDSDLRKDLPGKKVDYIFEDTSIWRNVLSA